MEVLQMNLKPTNFCESARILHIVDRHTTRKPSSERDKSRQMENGKSTGSEKEEWRKCSRRRKEDRFGELSARCIARSAENGHSHPAGMPPPRCYVASSRRPRNCSKVTQTVKQYEIRILILRNWKSLHPLTLKCAREFIVSFHAMLP